LLLKYLTAAGHWRLALLLFEPTSVLDNRPLGPAEGWWTWSNDCKNLLHDLTDLGESLPEPTLLSFGSDEYDYTFDVPSNFSLPPGVMVRVERFANSLHDRTIFPSLALLTGLLPPGVTSLALKILFAATRSILVRRSGDPHTVLFTPLGRTGNKGNMRFELHADLYPPLFLLNVFDNVPSDASGASLFLSAEKFVEIVHSVKTLPYNIRLEMLDCLSQPVRKDRYEYFYDLLYRGHSWTNEMKRKMDTQAHAIKLFHGEGYLLHDRKWLHGRMSPSNGVPQDRLYRLVFDTSETLAVRRSFWLRQDLNATWPIKLRQLSHYG